MYITAFVVKERKRILGTGAYY